MLDTYEPELERYGGPGAREAAERAFHADSIACQEQLELLENREIGLDRTVLTALGHVDLACRVNGLRGGFRHLTERAAPPGRPNPLAARRTWPGT